MIHIEGMGLLGSLLAHRLSQRGEDFTWSDTDEPFTAWHCSTGLAYPDKDSRDGLLLWHKELPNLPEAAAAPYLFAHKNPPHSAKDEIIADYGKLRRSSVDAVSFNVPVFVQRMRDQYANRRSDQRWAQPNYELVRCHTTPDRGAGYLWGWTAKVDLDFENNAVAGLASIAQPAFYGKVHRFNLTYAYPIPGEGLWWAGSVLVHQRNPTTVPTWRLADYYLEWFGNAQRLLGISHAAQAGPILQGWRPRAVLSDSGRAARHSDGSWSMPPMPTDGMRRGLLIVDDFLAQRELF